MTNDAIAPAPAPAARTSMPLLLMGLVVGLGATIVLSSIAAIAVFILSGGPLADEWVCSKGEFPATAKPAGSQCFRYGEEMPPGWTAVPEGNQRMDYRS